jgi:cysteine desulfurase
MTIDPIYLDYNATTPCDPRVVEKMLPYFSEQYGNPANGLHIQGRKSARAVAEAREQISALLAAQPGEVFFTAGATESNNLAILGLARAARRTTRRRIVTTAVEHKAVLLPSKKLADDGFDIVVLPVNRNGKVDIEAARDVINTDTLLVSVQAANNELGTIQPVTEISLLAHEKGAYMHCDAAQAVGKIPVNVNDLGVDLLSVSAHKLYGPKGIGCLYVRGGTRTIALEPLAYGGGQENGLRSGTTNVPGAVGFGEACAIAQTELMDEMARLTALRDTLEMELLTVIDGLLINARQTDRLPNTSSLTFPGVDADALLLNMPELMSGTGSACTSGAVEPSHVLTAIGLSRAESSSTIRLSLGRFTYRHEIREIVALLFQTSATLRITAQG